MAIAFMHNRRPGGAVVVLTGAHIHRYRYTTEVPPTCTEQGYTQRSCKCGDGYKVNYTEALGHDFNEAWLYDENGHWSLCTRCGEPSEVIEHTPGDEATEDTPQVCTVCGYEIVPALGHIHKYTDEVTVAPTCTEKGTITHTCECGYSFIEDMEALGHKMNFTTLVAPTCSKGGETYYWCERAGCSYSYTEKVSAKGHPIVAIPAVAATCTTAGSTAGEKCSECGWIYKAPVTIPALGHDFSENRYRCSRCGYTPMT